MADAVVPLKLRPQRGFLQTLRRDAWWIGPALTLLGFGAFLIWANFRVFEGDHYYSGHGRGASIQTNYLTPFYSPLFFDAQKADGTLTHQTADGQPFPSGHAILAHKPSFLPGFVSAAALILIFPAGFRFTCYYYRGAYYKAFWGDPPNCAVGEPRKSYLGEKYLPLVFQNIHRYFLYAALLFIALLAWDAVQAFKFYEIDAATGARKIVNGEHVWHIGVGFGTILMAVNVVLIAMYTCGCHSLRHLIGGKRDCVSENATSHKMYQCVTCLNNRHMLWAWCSLITVGLTDVYIRGLAMGCWTDFFVVF